MPRDELIDKKISAVPVEKKEIGIDTENTFEQNILDAAEVSQLNLANIQTFSNVAQTREETYALIDTMAQDDSIASILETYAEDITETNDKGQIVWCESSDDNVAKYVSYLLDTLNVDKHIYEWVYNLVKYGDVYLKLFRDSDYGNDLLFGEKEKKKGTLNEDINLKVSGKDDHYVHYVEMVANPGEMFELTKFGKTVGYIQAPVNVQQNYDKGSTLDYILNYKMRKSDVNVYGATDFVHGCLQSNGSRSPEEVSIFLDDTNDPNADTSSSTYRVRRGQSLLANNFKIWRELSLLENSILLNRITRSAIVRVLNVNVGDMPKEQVNSFITRLKERIEQKSAINTDVSLTEYTNPGPIENIIYVPTHGDQGNITANVIGGDGTDVKSLTDLDYFQNKLYGAFRVPKQFFGITDDAAGFNGGSSLAIISSRYGKAIKQIQNTACQFITDIVNLFLLDKGLNNYINKFTIRMQQPITQEELDRRENMRNRVGVISDIMNQVGNVVTDETIKAKILKSLISTAVSDSEVISLIQDQIDLLENGEETGNGEEKGETGEPNRPAPMSDFGGMGGGGYEEPTFENEPPMEEPTGEETIQPVETEMETGTTETSGEEGYLPSPSELNLDMLG